MVHGDRSATVMQNTHTYTQSRAGPGLTYSALAPPPFAEALKAMEKVASHINEMQKIYEDYGAVFDQLVAEQAGQDKEVDSHFGKQISNRGAQETPSCRSWTEFHGTPAPTCILLPLLKLLCSDKDQCFGVEQCSLCCSRCPLCIVPGGVQGI